MAEVRLKRRNISRIIFCRDEIISTYKCICTQYSIRVLRFSRTILNLQELHQISRDFKTRKGHLYNFSLLKCRRKQNFYPYYFCILDKILMYPSYISPANWGRQKMSPLATSSSYCFTHPMNYQNTKKNPSLF